MSGPGPEGGDQPAGGVGDVGHDLVEHGIGVDGAGDVNDDRVPGRALLGGEDAGYRGGIEGIRAETVDRLRRQRHQAAGAKNLRGPIDGSAGLGGIEMLGIDGQAEGLHPVIFAGRRATTPPRIYSRS